MAFIDQDSLAATQPELVPGETVLWAGRPSTKVIFHSDDLLLVPFSLMWGGFAIFWEFGASGLWQPGAASANPAVFMVLWGIPFVVIGQYLIWGRFVYAAWKKRRTHYAVTNRRVIAVQNGWKRQMSSTYVDSLPTLMKESRSGDLGTLRFAESAPMWSGRRGWGAWDALAFGTTPVFVDIEAVDSVYRLVSDLREKTSATARISPDH